MAKTNRFSTDEEQTDFSSLLDDLDDETFDSLHRVFMDARKRRGMDDEDWSADYRRKRAKDNENENLERPEKLEEPEGEDRMRLNATDSKLAHDRKYSIDPRINLQRHREVAAARTDIEIRQHSPAMAADGTNFYERFPSAARLIKKRGYNPLEAMVKKDGDLIA